ncbi:MAG TPA: hypothetical protein VF173_27120 [Thermoanaerobaculia bacterium]|nr:hypothetical protein [Thermoanaerobaculia bacterium]
MSEPTAKEQFDLLYERLKFYHDSAIDAVFKVTASLLLVMGWVTTSETARRIFAADQSIRWCAIVAILLFDVQFVAAAFRSTERSQNVARQLDSLAYMPRVYYRDLVLRSSLTLAFALMNSAFCAAAIVVLLRSVTP